ncbi:MAG: hypothetical protein FH761_16895 [Firmicutes bacterium]|nr:hypothetical protein [Bacillota bacterium]
MVNINEENKETNLNNNEDNDKSKSLVTIILGVVLGMSFLYFAFIQPQVDYLIYSLLLASLVFMVIEPLVRLIIKSSKGEHIEFKENIKLIVYSIFLVTIFINAYEIFNSGEEVLFFNYKIVSVLIVTFIIYSQYQNIRKIIKDNKKGNKGWRITGTLFMFALSLVMFIFPRNLLFVEHKAIDMNELVVPNYITVGEYKEDNSSSDIGVTYKYRENKRIEIRDEKLIGQLVDELQVKKLDNLRGFAYFDYYVKKDDKESFYSIYFEYNSRPRIIKDNRGLYLYRVELHEDDQVVISEFDRETGDTLVYKTYISNELTKKIIAHVQED